MNTDTLRKIGLVSSVLSLILILTGLMIGESFPVILRYIAAALMAVNLVCNIKAKP